MPEAVRKTQPKKVSRKPVRRIGSAGVVAPVALATAGPVHGGILDRVRLKKSGGSLVMTVPAAARKLLGLTEGQEMAISVRDAKVVADPVPVEAAQPVRFSLEEMLVGYTRPSRKQRAWMDAPPVGRETW